MADRDKIVKKLEECLSASCRGFRTCPYSDADWDAVRAAMALLREQGPVRPQTVLHTGNREEPTIQALICGNCHKIMGGIVFNYCPWCGRKVLWDG